MKKLIFLFVLLSSVLSINAQNEPDFAWEPYVFNSDSTFSEALPCESCYAKAKAAASMYLTGIGKVKSYYYIDGLHSSLNIDNQNIIINTDNTSPQQSISIIKLETLESKRRWKSGEAGAFTGATSNEDNSVKLKYKKYGKSSVIIDTSDFENGEYCLAITNMMTNSKSAKVYTFNIGNKPISSNVIVENPNICQYVDKNGNRCHWKVDKNGKYCTQHKYMYNK